MCEHFTRVVLADLLSTLQLENYFFLPKCSSSQEKSIGERIMHFGAPGDELRPFENRVFHAFSGVQKSSYTPTSTFTEYDA